jgi:hypothetical protein
MNQVVLQDLHVELLSFDFKLLVIDNQLFNELVSKSQLRLVSLKPIELQTILFALFPLINKSLLKSEILSVVPSELFKFRNGLLQFLNDMRFLRDSLTLQSFLQ